MGFTRDLINGLGQYLHTENVGSFAPPWTTQDVAISAYSLPASPDKGIAITPYTVSDSGGTDSVVGIQFKIRGKAGDRTSAPDILDRIFDACHDLEHALIGTIPIVRMWSQSGAPLGLDSSNRQEHTANYYIQLTRTGTHRED